MDKGGGASRQRRGGLAGGSSGGTGRLLGDCGHGPAGPSTCVVCKRQWSGDIPLPPFQTMDGVWWTATSLVRGLQNGQDMTNKCTYAGM